MFNFIKNGQFSIVAIPCLISNNSYRMPSRGWLPIFYGVKYPKHSTCHSTSSFWPQKNLSSSQPNVTALHLYSWVQSDSDPWPLTPDPDHAWCFPTCTFLSMSFATWDVQLLLLKSYVKPTIAIFAFFKNPSALKKKKKKRQFNERCWQRSPVK